MDFNMDIDIDIDLDIDDDELQTLLRQFDNSTLERIDLSLIEKLLQEHEELGNISEHEPPVKPEDVNDVNLDEQHNEQLREQELHSDVENVGLNSCDVNNFRDTSNAESLHKDHNTTQQDSSTRQLTCDICKKCFGFKSTLMIHMRSYSDLGQVICMDYAKLYESGNPMSVCAGRLFVGLGENILALVRAATKIGELQQINAY